MKLTNLFIIVVCVFLPITAHAETSDDPILLSVITGDVKNLSNSENAKLRGENIRSPARVHAQTYCRNYNSGESRCVYVSRSRRYAGNGKYWYRTLFQDFTGAYYWSKY